MKKNHCMLIYYQVVVKELSGKILKKYYIFQAGREIFRGPVRGFESPARL